MKKDFDYEDETNREEMDSAHWERARILVKIIPFVLIIVIFAVTLLINTVNRQSEENAETLTESPLLSEVTDEAFIEQDEEVVLPAPTSDREQAAMQTAEPEYPTPTPYQEIMEEIDYSKVEFHKEEQLAEMMAYWADSNQKALDDLAYLDRFRAMSWQLRGTEDFYYYGDTDAKGQPSGTGIAVYADNQYYYGGWENGKRSGEGTWRHYHIHVQPSRTDLYTYHQYVGSWKNDMPDGEGFEHFDFNSELLKEREYYSSNFIGSYSEGLIDGEFYITTIEINGDTKEWEAQADHGAWVYQNDHVDPKGNRTIYVGIYDSDAYIWMHPRNNHDIGISCLIIPGEQ